MADGNEVPFTVIVTFGVRNDKSRGLLIESLDRLGNVYLFKFHKQPLHRHCQQMQNIVKAANIQRAKKLHIDVTEFVLEYFQRVADGTWEVAFPATKLMSTHDQVEKVYTLRLNKEFGIAKRMLTIEENKQAKIVLSNQTFFSKIASAEAEFQRERARRIDQLFGGAGRGGSHQAGGTGRGGSHRGGGAGREGSYQGSDAGRGGFYQGVGAGRGGSHQDGSTGRGGSHPDGGTGRGGLHQDGGTGRGGLSQSGGVEVVGVTHQGVSAQNETEAAAQIQNSAQAAAQNAVFGGPVQNAAYAISAENAPGQAGPIQGLLHHSPVHNATFQDYYEDVPLSGSDDEEMDY